MHAARAAWRGVAARTFTPSWLPDRWRQPATGYLVAVLLQGIALVVVVVLAEVLVGFAFPALLSTLAVACVALAWGLGPSLLGTLAGTTLLTGLLLSPVLHLNERPIGRVVALGLYVAVGCALSGLASQSVRGRRDAQERARREEEAAARLAATIEAMADGVLVYDRNGRVVQTNAALRAFLAPGTPAGTPAAPGAAFEAAARLLRDHGALLDQRDEEGRPLSLDERPLRRVLHGEVLTGDRAQDLRVRTGNGDERLVSVSGAPVRDADGAIVGGVLGVRDVTERRRLEREVTERVGQLEAIIDSIADAVYVYDTAGRLLRTNAAARALLPPDRPPDYAAQPVEDRVVPFAMRDAQGRTLSPDDWPLRRILRGEALTGARADDVLIRAPDGQDRHVTVSGAPVHDREGRRIGAVVIVHDVTVRRRAEQRTREALQALLAMAEALVLAPGEAGSVTSRTGYIALDNTQALPPEGVATLHSADSAVMRRLVELARHVLDCQHVSLIAIDMERDALYPLASAGVPPAQEERWRAAVRAAPARAYGADPDVAARLRADEVATVDMRQPPYRDLPNPSGAGVVLVAPLRVGTQLAGILAANRGNDARPFTADEIALARATARLAALVVERGRLLGARAEAERLAELDRVRADVIATVSHDLQQPLTAIRAGLGLVEMGAHDRLTPEERELLDAVRHNAERLRAQVDDLLAANQIDAGTLRLERVPLDLRDVVTRALGLVQPMLQEKGQTLALDLPRPLPLVGDARRLEQVVINLLANAHRHTPPGTHVAVEGRLTAEGVRLVVRDDGPGIPAPELEAIFGRFQRRGGGEGSGLGLSIVRAIVALHGGRVWAESPAAEGRGAAFHVVLPHETPQRQEGPGGVEPGGVEPGGAYGGVQGGTG